ncbi:MAG: hypothetical protein AAGA42_21270, partial [Actinomycetota bacterium]
MSDLVAAAWDRHTTIEVGAADLFDLIGDRIDRSQCATDEPPGAEPEGDHQSRDDQHECPALRLDPATAEVSRHGQPIELTRREMALL